MPKREETSCQECGDKLNGRRDKKFCDVSCRNAFNNTLNIEKAGIVRRINNYLRKNRLILKDLKARYPEKRACNVHRSQLTDSGFRFDFYTSSYTTKQGNVYFFNYEFGFMELEEDRIVIVENIDEKKRV
jgi:hypothetical protein|tara:strand:- start:782 stop:1171 length:390 start_codon:yes stop_codon:yes gene_type:complete